MNKKIRSLLLFVSGAALGCGPMVKIDLAVEGEQRPEIVQAIVDAQVLFFEQTELQPAHTILRNAEPIDGEAAGWCDPRGPDLRHVIMVAEKMESPEVATWVQLHEQVHAHLNCNDSDHSDNPRSLMARNLCRDCLPITAIDDETLEKLIGARRAQEERLTADVQEP